MPADCEMNRDPLPSNPPPTTGTLESRLIVLVPILVGVTVVLSAWRMLLGVAVISGLGWAWKQYQQKEQQRLSKLNALFYQLIQENQGRLTALDFAMHGEISGTEAQEYLEERAREFAAGYEITDNGGMVYCFSSIKLPERYQTIDVASVPAMSEPEAPKAVSPKKRRVVLPPPMNQTELATRLGVHPTTVSKNKNKPEFLDWSREKDPAGFSWTYAPATKQFFALELEGDRKSK